MEFKYLFLGAFFLAVGSACPGPKVDAKCAASRLELAKEYLGKLQIDNAKIETDKALACNPRSDVGHNLLGLIAGLRAVKNVQLLELDDCLNGVDAEVLGVERDRQMGEAERHFAHAIELAPDYGEAWSNRGSASLDRGEFEAAVRYYTKALELPARLSNIGLTRANLGWAYYKLGDYPRAAKELRQANQFNPGECLPNYRLGRVYFARQEWNNALERFSSAAAAENCSRYQELHLYLMKTQIALGAEAEASASRGRCVDLAPKSCVARECAK